MLQDLREGMVAGDEDEGEGLVVPEHHVVARLEPLDEIGFEQQSLGLGGRGDELHARRVGDHGGDAIVVASCPRIALHALLQPARLADIEHLAGGIDHAVDAGAAWRGLGVTGNDGRAGLHPAQRFAGAGHERGTGAFGLLLGHGLRGKYGLQAGSFKALGRPGYLEVFPPGAPSQARCWPLSSAIICPVTEGLSSRKRTARHTSSTVAARPSGVARHSRSKSV